MGLESGGNVDEMMGLDMGLEGDEEAKDSKIKIRVFINFDEDDDNKYDINLNELFKREDLTLPYYVDVSKFNRLFLYKSISYFLLNKDNLKIFHTRIIFSLFSDF